FSGSDTVFLEPVFRGGNIESVFGGVTLDLRKTDLQEGVSYLKVSTVFGGVTLFIPPSWNVEIQSDSVFGNFKDNRPYAAGVDKNSKLIIKAECVFGGGEIK
ncbi:MAG: cell wall-active antibiotics response protein, partial [Bacteroidales bacterium]|nr:cell wall-active antibiotics response protein [Bacteroidales bacterium]